MTNAPDETTQLSDSPVGWPMIRTIGVDGFLVSFGDSLSEPANRAALAFRAELDRQNWSGIEETSTSLVSAYIRFDLRACSHDILRTRLNALAATQNWFDAELSGQRKLWQIPTVFGTDLAPQLDEAANLAGLSREEAIASISNAQIRVQTIGFAPGQPYLGALPPAWDIPRQTSLTKQVPEGAVTVAIRQIVLFSVASPTGWRHVGQTAFKLFRPDDNVPFALRPGDEVRFVPTTSERLHAMRNGGPDGGATYEVLS